MELLWKGIFGCDKFKFKHSRYIDNAIQNNATVMALFATVSY